MQGVELSSEALAGLAGALLGAFITVVFGWWMQRIEQLDAYKREFQTAVTALIDLEERNMREVLMLQNPAEREFVSGILNTKKSIHLETAEFLARKLRSRIAPSEYMMLANAQQSNSNFEAAEQGFVAAVRSARARNSKIGLAVAHRMLGAFYFIPMPLQDLSAGRRHFRRSCEAFKGSVDPYSAYTLALTCEMWGHNEHACGNFDEAKRLIDQARDTYSGLPDVFPLKALAIGQLESRLAQRDGKSGPFGWTSPPSG